MKSQIVIFRDTGGTWRAVAAELGRHQPACVDFETELRSEALAPWDQAEIVVVCGANTGIMARQIRLIRRASASVTIYVVADRLSLVAPGLPKLARGGCDAVFTLEARAARAEFAEAVRVRLGAPAPRAEIEAIASTLPPGRGRTVALLCLRGGVRHLTGIVIAEFMVCDRRTLGRWLERAHLAGVSDWIGRGKLLQVKVLRARGHSLTNIAQRLSYASAAGVAKVVSRAEAPCSVKDNKRQLV